MTRKGTAELSRKISFSNGSPPFDLGFEKQKRRSQMNDHAFWDGAGYNNQKVVKRVRKP
jgi:type IV secretory pathway VirB3-like protein